MVDVKRQENDPVCGVGYYARRIVRQLVEYWERCLRPQVKLGRDLFVSIVYT